MFVFMSVVVTVWGSVGKIVFFSLGVLKYVVCLCRGCDGCIVRRISVGARVWGV